ncbi:hypothetical protein [Sandarakinorhabdus sp.]|uniref:hypothetical protein n=1 Tax=Sandarakinorhabdus sp. TaxID=1916663 RepID=UPI0033405C30
MRFRAMVAAVLMMGWAALASAQPAAPSAPAAPAVTPKIVVQAMQVAGIDVAAWSANSRFIFTASGILREFLVWDVARGQIIDRIKLPGARQSTTEVMQLRSMALAADGRTLRIEGEVLDLTSANLIGQRVYLIDSVSRRVTLVPPPPMPPRTAPQSAADQRRIQAAVAAWQTRTQRWIQALEVFYQGGSDMTRAEAAQVLPALPPSPDGQWRLQRAAPAFALLSNDNRLRTLAVKGRFSNIDDAAMSPDGRRLALLQYDSDPAFANVERSLIDVFDTAQGRFVGAMAVPGTYDKLLWTNAGQILALPFDSDDDPLDGAMQGVPAPVLRLDAATGAVLASHPPRCFVAPLPDGSLVGAGLANCRSQVGADKALVRLVNGRWQALPGYSVPADAHVRIIVASPRGDRLLVATRLSDGQTVVTMVDAQTGEVGAALVLPDAILAMSAFSADGRKIWLLGNNGVTEWLPDAPAAADGTPAVRDFAVQTTVPSSVASDGRQLLVVGPLEERMVRIDLATGKPLSPVDYPGGVAVGFLPGRPVMWSVSIMGQLRMWNWRNGQVMMITTFLPDQHFVTVAQDGRYDTNLGPDAENFRWFIPSAPFLSLAPQTFMRDFFEPQLIRKLMDCTVANNCGAVLKPVPPIAGLNFLLPSVRITGITSTGPGEAAVTLSVTEFVNAAGQRSGAYGAKLLMNGREVAQNPDDGFAEATKSLVDWRAANVIQASPRGEAREWNQIVQVPSDGRPIEFAAYAFNADRVKSSTVRTRWTPPPMPRRQRRAFVLTIGVDEYTEPRLALNFAVSDAAVIGDRLAAIPGYEMRRANLVTRRLADGRVVQVTRADINTALGILAGFPPGPHRDTLANAGHDGSALDNATPDDIVIISFSGHGFADAQGNFALVPSDAAWPALAAAPEAQSVISATNLTMWLRAIAAGEIALIIDACHSGAAVATPDFKPGPMGDTGLGQLAYDKGLRILAATQADDVALESASLRQGLLTAALGEGLTPQGGPADLNRDGRVRLDEWLRYAVARLPSLNEEVRRGGGPMAARGVRLVMRAPNAQPPRVQEPSLFDFNAGPSPVVLRGQQ